MQVQQNKIKVMWYDIINKTRSRPTEHIALLSEEDRATYRKFCDIWTRDFWDMLADRHIPTRSSQYFAPPREAKTWSLTTFTRHAKSAFMHESPPTTQITQLNLQTERSNSNRMSVVILLLTYVSIYRWQPNIYTLSPYLDVSISSRDRNVKIRYQMFSCDLWMWLVSIYQPNESNCREIREYLPWVLVLVTLEGVYGGPVLSTVTVQHKYNTESSITKEHFVTLSVRCFNHKHLSWVKILNELR